jgi:hypothetical protein
MQEDEDPYHVCFFLSSYPLQYNYSLLDYLFSGFIKLPVVCTRRYRGTYTHAHSKLGGLLQFMLYVQIYI